ncbi:MAG: methionine--tRNA ligase, partial [Deltaproteobacteria bacterium]
RFKNLWVKLNVSNDDFIRTTQERHIKAASHFFETVQKNGDIYLGMYEDWYCTPCESFWTEQQLVDGKCPDCGREVNKLQEESYFFKMSKYQNPLLKYLEENPAFVRPETRYNELVSFVKGGLKDLSISRTTFSWGIPVPGNPKHVIYVWFDALLNYITALGYPDDMDRFNHFWPADVHLIGKDILRFHAVYWPTFLMSAGIAPPRQVFAHGWWTIEGKKMSKSLRNVVDPYRLVDVYGVDPLRYFLLREVPFGQDGDYSDQAMVHRINSDLANDLGNLLNRSVGMLVKYFDGRLEEPSDLTDMETEIQELTRKIYEEVATAFQAIAFHQALTAIWRLVGRLNKYIDETAPWQLAKDPEKRGRLMTVMFTLFEGIRHISQMIYPFMPESAQKMREQLLLPPIVEGTSRLDADQAWGQIPLGQAITRKPPLFPRIEPEAS